MKVIVPNSIGGIVQFGAGFWGPGAGIIHQVVLPRKQLADDGEILDFLMNYVGKFDMYVEDDYAAFVRYCFEDPLDAEIFRSRFEPKADRFKLAG